MMRIRLLLVVAAGVAAGLASNHLIPTESIWPGAVIGITKGIGLILLIQVIAGKGDSAT